jgi:glutathione S-transferase
MGLDWRYELVERGADGKAPASYIANVHPLGQVPALGLPDGSAMTESAAIMIYLADLKPGFAPAPGDAARGRYLGLMLHLATNTYNADLRVFYAARYSTAEGAADGICAAAKTVLARDCEVLSHALGDGPYFLGKQFSALDIYAAMILGWVMQDIADVPFPANLRAHFDRVKARPAILPVFERNKL